MGRFFPSAYHEGLLQESADAFCLMEKYSLTDETIEILQPSKSDYREIFGIGDRNIRMIKERYGVQVVYRDGTVKVIGNKEAVKLASTVIKELDVLI